jgi:GAF domain-containing protein
MVGGASERSVESEDGAVQRRLEGVSRDAEVARVLLGLAGALSELRTPEDTLDRVARIVPDLFGADRCIAARWDEPEERLVVMASTGYGGSASSSIEGDLELLRECVASDTPVLVADYIGIPLSRWGQRYGALGLGYSEARSFGREHAALARGVSRQVGVALANARRFNLLQDLRRLGIRVGARLRLPAVIAEVAMSASELLNADTAALYFFDASTRSLFLAGAHGPYPEDLGRVDVRIEPWTRLLDGLTASGRAGDAELVAAPVPSSGGGLLGAVVVVFPRSFELQADEEEALSVLAAQSGTAIENAQRFERQRSVARSLQRALLAMEPPTLDGWSIAAVYEPAADEAEIGGDFYDAFDLPEGGVALVVGDVAGKGAEAAAGTAMAKYMLRAFAMRNPAPASVLFHLNNALAKGWDEDRFTTLMYAVFDPCTARCQISLGGHPPPLVYRAGTGGVEFVTAPGSIVGAFADQQFEQASVELELGDVLVAYTDGLVDARSGDEFYGPDRIVAALRRVEPRADAGEIARLLLSDAEAFGTISDDTVVFVLGPAGGDRGL